MKETVGNGSLNLPFPLFMDPNYNTGRFLKGEYSSWPGADINLMHMVIDVLEDYGESDAYRSLAMASIYPDYSYIAVDPTHSLNVYMSFSGYTSGRKVYRSTDAGSSWSNWSGTLPNIPVNCIVCDNTSKDGVYIGTDVGVFYRDNTMSDWVPFFNQLPNVIVQEMEINSTSNKLIAGTFGRGIWQTNLYGNCVYSFYLNDANNVSTSSTQYYAASNHITSLRTVYSSYNNTSVTYKAGSYIDLKPDFNTQYNAKFEALIGSCTSTVINAPGFDIKNRVSGQLSGYTQSINSFK
jgi:hypothetical protein